MESIIQQNSSKVRALFKLLNVSSIIVYLIWYITPIVGITLYGLQYKLLMIGVIIMWLITALILEPKWFSRWNIHLVIVALNIVVFISMTLLSTNGNPKDFLMLGLSFWFPLFVFHYYKSSGWETEIRWICKVIICCLLITGITTLIALLNDPRVVRVLTFSGNDFAEDIILNKLNVGGFDFVYGILMLLPTLLSLLIQGIATKKKKQKIFVWFSILMIIAIIWNASFAIGLLIMIIAFFLGLFSRIKPWKLVYWLIFAFLLFIMFPKDILSYPIVEISNWIDSPVVKSRLLELASSISGKSFVYSTTNLAGRMYFYNMSWSTFGQNPIMGVGPYYYIKGVGVGYHSQILDDLARYGLFGGLFFLTFIFSYYSYIQRIWTQIDFKANIFGAILVFVLISLLNPTFSQPTISVILFFLLPALPEILRKVDESINQESEIET